MIKITGLGGVNTTSSVKKKDLRKAGGADFSQLLEPETSETAHVTSPHTVAPVNSLLALQMVSGDESSKQKTLKRGSNLLDRLNELRLGLLEGRIPAYSMDRLLQEIRSERGEIADPRLLRIIEEIELRAEVELAKLGKR